MTREADLQSLYGDLSDTKPSSGVMLTEGVHDIEVTSVTHTLPGYKGSYFCVRGSVLTSSNPNAHPVGSSVDWLSRVADGPGKSNADGARLGRGAARSFVAECLAVSFAEVGVEELRQATSEAQPLVGTKLRATCSLIKTKAGSPFTRVIWQLLELSPSLQDGGHDN